MEGATNIDTLPNAAGSMTGVQPVAMGGVGGGGGGVGGGAPGGGGGGGGAGNGQQPPVPNFQQPISMSVQPAPGQQPPQQQMTAMGNMVIGGAPTMGGMPNMPGLPGAQYMNAPVAAPMSSAVPQDMVSQIIQQLQGQGALVTGAPSTASGFPARDVPTTFADLTQDVATRANFVPGMGGSPDGLGRDYIRDYEQEDAPKRTEPPRSMLDASWMDEIMLPVIMAAIFFLFQLPFINRQLRMFFPTLFTKEGHLDLAGLVIKSLFFGGLCYGVKKVADLSMYL
jgi:hypothetical protein